MNLKNIFFIAVITAVLFTAQVSINQKNSLYAETCPGKSEYSKIEYQGTYPIKLRFKDEFTLISNTKKGDGSDLKFKNDKNEILEVIISNFPVFHSLKINEKYTIFKTYFRSIGGSIKTFSIFDKNGLLLSISSSPGNPGIKGFKIKAKITEACHYMSEKFASSEAQAEVFYKNESLIKLYAGQSGSIIIDGKKYLIKITYCHVNRRVSKKVAFEGFKMNVHYHLIRQ